MKKILSLALILCLCLGMASIGFAERFGLGIVTDIASSKDAVVDSDPKKDGLAQVNSTIVAVVLDDDGVIVDIKIDVAQTRVNFSPEGAITSDKAAEIQSKMELKEAYNMKRASAIEKELYEQILALETFCVGKPAADIIGMVTYQRDENHVRVADDADLRTSCTIDIGEILDALAKAVDTAVAR